MLMVLHTPIASYCFHLIGKRKIASDYNLIAAFFLYTWTFAHRLLLVLVRKSSPLFSHCRRLVECALPVCKRTVTSGVSKCFLLILKPCESKWTLNLPNPKGNHTVNGEYSITVKNYTRLSIIIAII